MVRMLNAVAIATDPVSRAIGASSAVLNVTDWRSMPMFLRACRFSDALNDCAASTLTRFDSAVAVDVAKLGSSPSAAANSFSVSSVPGAESTRFATAVDTVWSMYCRSSMVTVSVSPAKVALTLLPVKLIVWVVGGVPTLTP